MKDALETVKNEHRSLAAVARAMRDLVERIRDGGGPPDFDRLRAMLYYLDAYSSRVHHPREEEFLFQPLRARGGDVGAIVDDLEREHARVAAAMRSVEQALLRFEAGGESEFVAFATAVEGYCDFYLRHMQQEESLVLPLVDKLFGDADWARMETAGYGARAVQEGVQEDTEFRQLFRRIVGAGSFPPGNCRPATPA